MLGTFIFVTNFTGFIMLRKEIFPRFRKILGYSTDGWLVAYRRGDKDLQYLYDQLYEKTDAALELAKMIERYKKSKR